MWHQGAFLSLSLFTIHGSGHGGFSHADYVKSYQAIWSFLSRIKIIP